MLISGPETKIPNMQDTVSEQKAASVAVQPSQQKTMISRSDDGISQEEMAAELNRVITSPDFPATLRNRRFLSFAVERTLEAPAGAHVRVRAYDVATKIFGRPDDFSTILDPIVRIEAGKLRRDLETYYLKSGRLNPLRIELPRGGYDPIFLRQLPAGDADPQAPAALGDLAADARAELDRIVKSADFPATDRNRKFLTYVVENELAGRCVSAFQRAHTARHSLTALRAALGWALPLLRPGLAPAGGARLGSAGLSYEQNGVIQGGGVGGGRNRTGGHG
jgi:hypothetical protein